MTQSYETRCAWLKTLFIGIFCLQLFWLVTSRPNWDDAGYFPSPHWLTMASSSWRWSFRFDLLASTKFNLSGPELWTHVTHRALLQSSSRGRSGAVGNICTLFTVGGFRLNNIKNICLFNLRFSWKIKASLFPRHYSLCKYECSSKYPHYSLAKQWRI